MSTRLPKIFYELRQLAKIWHPFAEKVQQNEDDKKPLPHFSITHVQKIETNSFSSDLSIWQYSILRTYFANHQVYNRNLYGRICNQKEIQDENP